MTVEGLEEVHDFLGEEMPAELGESPYNLPTEFLSYTQVRLWQTCGERYRRKYIDGVKEPQSSNLTHGKLVHSMVEEMLRHKMRTADIMTLEEINDTISDVISEKLAEVVLWDPKIPDREVLEASARGLVKLYHEQRLEHAMPKAVEVRVSGMLNGKVPFRGYIDMLEGNPMIMGDYTPQDESASLVPHHSDSVRDLKVTGKKYGPHQVENALQLTVYAHLMGVDHVGYDLLVETPKKRVQSFVQQSSVRSPQEKQHGCDVIEGVASAISEGCFPKADPESWVCTRKWCAFYDQCRGKKTQVPVLGMEETM